MDSTSSTSSGQRRTKVVKVRRGGGERSGKSSPTQQTSVSSSSGGSGQRRRSQPGGNSSQSRTPTRTPERERKRRSSGSAMDNSSDDVADLVARAKNMSTEDDQVDEVSEVETIFSPWQYKDMNAPVGEGGNEIEGKGDMEADRKSLLKRLTSGLDLTKIAIPVYYNEPTSFLHRMCEACQYYNFLNKAAEESDPATRLLYVTLFSIVPYASAERTSKPFNPMLGETFEWTTKDIRFIAEQVSHHPPICAGHMESKHWIFEQYKEVGAKFTGNAVVSPPVGLTYITFKDTQKKYTWLGLTSCVHNLIVGKLWIDHYGTYKVEVPGSKEYAEVTFSQCGWFSRGWHQVKATIYDENGEAKYCIDGHWNDKLYLRAPGDDPKDPTTGKLVWEKDKRPAKDKHVAFKGFSLHGQELNELTPFRMKTLIASDSRFRPDCRQLALLNYRKAGQQKWKLEEQQRAERKIRKERGDTWQHRFFKFSPEMEGKGSVWQFTGEYWKLREQRLQDKGIEDPVTPSTEEF